jgi:hypothetical protein
MRERRPFRTLVLTLVIACGSRSGGKTDAPGSIHDGATADAATVVVSCPGCPTFPGSGSACPGAATDPTLVYPPNGVLLPPNMNVIEVQFTPGSNNTLFEIDFENATTDVRLETMCNAITNTRGSATAGCSFDLDPTDWNYVATQNAGGLPVNVIVRAAPQNLSCIATSASLQISFASEPINGAIYYWQSVTQGGIAGATGGIFRKNFGNPDPTPEPFLTPGNLNKCVGCHYLSRDGLKMVFGDDDADSDDELTDDKFFLLDVTSGSAVMNALMTKGFAAWQGSAHDEFLVSDGQGMSNMSELVPYNGTTAMQGMPITFAGLGGKRVTNPDWSRDGTTVYFTATTPITNIMTGSGNYMNKDDTHGSGGSIWSVAVSGSGAFGTPMEIVTPGVNENDYYPAISPDNSTLIFDRAIGTTLATQDSYNNPNATLFAMPVSGGTPVELANVNIGGALTNSWPRWSPEVQTYQGKRLLWITFSSTRDYGLRVANQGSAFFNCYPPVSPENPSGDHKQAFAAGCTQPQLWMAAIDIDQVAQGADGSFPAFWLPFQDVTAHNHIAQWVDSFAQGSGSACVQVGGTCSATMPCCNGETCASNGNGTSSCTFLIP